MILEVGKWYIDGFGDLIHLTDYNMDFDYFISASGKMYDKTGCRHDSTMRPNMAFTIETALVREVNPNELMKAFHDET